MRLEDLRTEADLQRLDPVVAARLKAEPATAYDVLQVKLEVADALKRLGKEVERAISESIRRAERRRDRGE